MSSRSRSRLCRWFSENQEKEASRPKGPTLLTPRLLLEPKVRNIPLKLENVTNISKTQLFRDELLSLQSGKQALLQALTQITRKLPDVREDGAILFPTITNGPKNPRHHHFPEHLHVPGSLGQDMSGVCCLSVPEHIFVQSYMLARNQYLSFHLLTSN